MVVYYYCIQKANSHFTATQYTEVHVCVMGSITHSYIKPYFSLLLCRGLLSRYEETTHIEGV